MENTDEVVIRNQLVPGDLGAIISLHGSIYHKEYNYNRQFENYVAKGLVEFSLQYVEPRDRIWVVEDKGQVVGSIVIMARSGKVAQLRYFILLPEYRNIGLGKKLLTLAMDFTKSAGYHRLYLWTSGEFRSAAHLYSFFGFRKTSEVISNDWGREVTIECYETEV